MLVDIVYLVKRAGGGAKMCDAALQCTVVIKIESLQGEVFFFFFPQEDESIFLQLFSDDLILDYKGPRMS